MQTEGWYVALRYDK